MGAGPCPALLAVRASGLPFCLAARHLFHFAFFRSAGVVAGLLRLFRFDLLAGGSLAFLALVLG